jgi:hypothetical protein
MVILNIFLAQKSFKYFRRKTLFNLTNFKIRVSVEWGGALFDCLFDVNFEYVFLKKYLHDFEYKNMFRISMALAFDFTYGVFL